jgi:hypothetical protein
MVLMSDFVTAPSEGTPQLMAGAAAIRQAADQLAQGTGWCAVDTERASGFRYHNRVCLLQIRRAGAGTMLIDVESDAQATTDFIGRVLADTGWVVHAASTDLPYLEQLRLRPPQLFDTELAGRFLGFHRVNLAAMVEHYLGVRLRKNHGGEDWSRRPIPSEWLDYAALDVEYLLPLADAMRSELMQQHPKDEWVAEECDYLTRVYRGYSPTPKSWEDLKGVHGLRTSKQLQVARWLWRVREKLARASDTAVSRLLPDKALVALATELPTTVPKVMRTPGYPPRLRRKARYWANQVDKALRTAQDRWPEPFPIPTYRDTPPSRYTWSRYYPESFPKLTMVREELARVAAQVEIPVENMIQSSDTNEIVWRSQELKEVTDDTELLELLQRLQIRPWQQKLCLPIFTSILLP